MPAVVITPQDLEPFADIPLAKAQAMIEDAVARASVIAPCIMDTDFAYSLAARAVLRGAILRWHDAGTGAIVTSTAGPFGETVDNSQARRHLFWPSEITELQKLCAGAEVSGAFSIDTVRCGTVHADVCSLAFGALYCSCGADIAGFPLYEV